MATCGLDNKANTLKTSKSKEKRRKTAEKVIRRCQNTRRKQKFRIAQDRSLWRVLGEAFVHQWTEKGWRKRSTKVFEQNVQMDEYESDNVNVSIHPYQFVGVKEHIWKKTWYLCIRNWQTKTKTTLFSYLNVIAIIAKCNFAPRKYLRRCNPQILVQIG